jgi:outer membrane protein
MTFPVSKLIALIFMSMLLLNGSAQEKPLSPPLKELLKLAVDNYPLLKAKAFDVQAASEGVNASKRSLVPTLDASYQAGFVTYNNIIGMASTSMLVPISGPPSQDNNYTGVFGSSAGLILNWQPVTFGQRTAQVDYSKAGLQYSTADAKNEVFQHEVRVINAYLDALTANELVKVYERNLFRTETNYSAVRSLVISGVKPGLDTSMFKADISRARIDLMNIRKYRQQTLISLSQFLGSDKLVEVSDSSFFKILPSALLPNVNDSLQNPLLSLYNSNIALSRAKGRIISRTMLPTLGVWGTTYARGSGVSYDGKVNSTDGLAFQRYNYGIGVQLSVPILQFARVNPQIQQQKLLVKSNEEKLQDVSLQLQKQLQMADTTFSNALSVARENPVLFESSEFSYKAMLSRYQSGLANYSDFVQSQYQLIKAEADNKTAYVNAWKALLLKAAVKGDLNLFLNQVK